MNDFYYNILMGSTNEETRPKQEKFIKIHELHEQLGIARLIVQNLEKQLKDLKDN